MAKTESVLFECLGHKPTFLFKKNVDGKVAVAQCPRCEKECIRAFPLALDIEFTNACPCRCPVCPRSKPDYSREVGYMSDAIFKMLFREIRQWNSRHTNALRLCWLHLGGEALLHPNFVEWTNRLGEKIDEGGANLGTLMVSTNAVPLTPKLSAQILSSKLHRLILSVDGVTKETYEKIRVGADFEKVQANVDYLLEHAKKRAASGAKNPQIWIQILKLNDNEEEWLPFVQRYTGNKRIRKVGAKGRQRRDIPGILGAKVFLKTIERFGGQVAASRHKGWDGAARRRFTCDKAFKRASVWWDGRVTICCYAIDQGPVMGSLESNSLHGIWHAVPFQNLRQEFLKYQETKGKDGTLPTLCENC